MPEAATPNRTDELTAQALLYVTGEMEPEEASAFEARAAGELACQEAMIQAVKLWSGTVGPVEPAPDAGYRGRVSERLRGRRALLPVPGDHRRAWWSPVAGGVVGALAATVLVMLVNPWQWLNPAPASPVLVAPAAPSGESTAEVIYSDLTNTDRLARIRGERELRRQKDDELRSSHPILEHLRKPRPSPTQRMM